MMLEKKLESWQGTARIDSSKYGDSFAVITASLSSLGDQAPHFSVQGETWTNEAAFKAQRENAMHSAGMLHDLVLELFPFLAPVVALHLADRYGVPMHAEANGWYWYSDNDGQGIHNLYSSPYASLTPHERAAAHLRVRPELLPLYLTRPAFSAFVDSLRPQWKLEAERALDLIIHPPNLDSLPEPTLDTI